MKIIMLLGFLGIVLCGCNSTFDGTNSETVESSLKKMQSQLSEEDKKMFNKDISILLLTSRGSDEEKLKQIHGMDYRQVHRFILKLRSEFFMEKMEDQQKVVDELNKEIADQKLGDEAFKHITISLVEILPVDQTCVEKMIVTNGSNLNLTIIKTKTFSWNSKVPLGPGETTTYLFEAGGQLHGDDCALLMAEMGIQPEYPDDIEFISASSQGSTETYVSRGMMDRYVSLLQEQEPLLETAKSNYRVTFAEYENYH
ncbi:MAG: DUF6694 family lipoprotein [Arenimonas sp.]